MNNVFTKSNLFRSSLFIIACFALLKLLIHLYTNAFAGYGIFRDELYYFACTERIDLGYVDQPPLSIYILAISRIIFGDSLFALRLIPAFAAALTVFITGLMVRELAGGKIALMLGCLAVIVAPIHLGMNTFFSMNSFDMLLWALAAYITILIIKHKNEKLWLLLGFIIGLGLLNKIGFLWFSLGLFLALLMTPQRKQLLTIWPYAAAFIALLFFSPYIIWNIQHDFAHLEFIRNATTYKYSSLTPIDFILGQVLILNPITLPLWLSGLYYFLFHKEGKTYRILGIIYLIAFLILVINRHSKAEYLAPAYPMLFSAGAILVEVLLKRKHWAWLKYTFTMFLIMSGIILAPLALPILPVKTYIAYTKFIGVAPTTAENKALGELPQFYADMFGWENMAATVSKVYEMIPLEERSQTVIFAHNYGDAGAIEYYSKKYSLPRVISPHNSYWIWGYGDTRIKTIIVIGGRKENHLRSCEEVEQVALIKCVYCMPYENNLPVFICRKLKRSIDEIWNDSKNFS